MAALTIRHEDQREAIWRYSAENATSLANWQLRASEKPSPMQGIWLVFAKTQWFYDGDFWCGGNGHRVGGNLTATKNGFHYK